LRQVGVYIDTFEGKDLVLALTSIDFGKQSQQEEEKNSRKAIDNRTEKL